MVSMPLFRAVLAGAFVLSLTACPVGGYPTCSGPKVTFPDGKCSAHYYKTDYGSGGATTQAWLDCEISSQRLGGNVVAFHALDHGIALRWLNANTLEVGVPSGVKLENKRSGDVYMGYALTYTYRVLESAEPEFTGCTPK
jgi:hypothetical protein